MKLTVLGCSGGLDATSKTTSFLVDDDILIDAGTGVEDLSIEQLARIDHVFLTHSHLDHIAALPLMVDSIGSVRDKPVKVYALAETVAALRDHIFNWTIWPDFTQIPHHDRPWMMFQEILIDQTVVLNDRKITALEARHTVPAVGYHLASASGSLVYSGDTGPNEEFWRRVNGVMDLKHLIVETAFANREQDLAVVAKHLYPIQLGEQLALLHRQPKLWITHLKPVDKERIASEVQAWAGRYQPQILAPGQTLEF